MGFVKCILCKIDHFIVDLICNFLVNSILNTSRNTFCFISIDKSLAFFFHNVKFLLGHGPAEKIASSQGKSGKALYDLHNLLLVHDTTVSRLQDWLQLRTIIVDGVWTVLAADILGNKVHRAWAVQGNSGDYILKAMWLQFFHESFHSAALQLEHTVSTTCSKRIQHFLVIIIYLLHIKGYAVIFLYIFYCVVDYSQGSKAKEIHFQKSQLLKSCHDKLGDNGSVLRAGKGHILGDVFLADYNSGSVHGGMSWKTFQTFGHVNQMMHIRLLVVCFFQFRVYFHGFVDCDKLHIRYFGRNHFRNGVYLGIWHIEDTAYITDNTAGCQSTECNNLNHTVFAVFPYNIVDYFLSSLKSEIHVNIRHGYSLRIQETFKQKVIFDWIK